MSEVLAYATALLEERLDRGRDLGRLRIELKIPVYFLHESENGFQQWTSGWKRVVRVVCEFSTCSDTLGAKDKLISFQTLLALVGGQRLRHGFPRWRSGKIRPLTAGYFQFGACFDDQTVVWFLQREERLNIAEIVGVSGRDRGGRQYV